MRSTTVRFALGLAVVATAVGLTAAATSASSSVSGPIKAAWIYVGPTTDHGWTQAHDDGRKFVQKALGDKVKTTFKENVPEGPQTAQVIEDLIRDGNKIIFSTSFGFGDAMAAAAAKHPDVFFEQATGSKTAKNLAEYFGAGEDAIYLSGMAAGAASKSGKIGYVSPFPIPEVIRHANAFALGAQATHPGATVKIIWTNTWFNPATEKKAAESLIAAGVDVLGQNQDSPATGEAAQAAGIPWVGYDSDARAFAPKAWLTAAVYNWGPHYLKEVKAALNGTWKTNFYYGNLSDNFVGLSSFGSSVSAATKAAIAKKQAAIKSGKFYEFAGPLLDQSGKVRVPAGKKMSLQDLYTMDWFVKGVIGNPRGG